MGYVLFGGAAFVIGLAVSAIVVRRGSQLLAVLAIGVVLGGVGAAAAVASGVLPSSGSEDTGAALTLLTIVGNTIGWTAGALFGSSWGVSRGARRSEATER